MSTASVLFKRRPGRPKKSESTTSNRPAVFDPALEETEPQMQDSLPVEEMEETDTAPVVKRRPGRPKGSKNKPKVAAPTATAPVAKRGPGRPRKNPEAAATAPVVKRGPGRPRKDSTAPTATVPVAKRGPGRPRKNPEALATAPVVKRGPGRPRKNPEATAAPVVKRGPGRPKGSKNKPKVTAAVTPTAPAVKRGPGRPRKNPEALATAPVVKRGPGRPRKNPEATAAPVVKRGPGRPRKNPEAITPVPSPRPVRSTGDVRKVLDNPFKAGDSIVIPAGSVFTSSAPTAKGRQVVKRGHQVTVHDIIPARVQPRKSETGSNVLVRPPRVRAKGSGGYWKDITLTDKIVRVNGQTPTYEEISFKLTADAMA